MTTVILKFAIINITAIASLTKNPVKLSMTLMLLSALTFSLMSVISGEVWFPTLFFLLFMGGILMMFMILSSVLPNEKSLKIKIFLPMMFLSMMSMGMVIKTGDLEMVWKQMKSFLETSNSLNFVVLILILYFFSSITMLSKEELPMRSIVCCEENLIL